MGAFDKYGRGGTLTSSDRYPIQELEYDGEVFSVGPRIPYRNGNGFLREVVVKTRGMFNSFTYVPVTLFGKDAEEVDETRTGCLIRVLARLYSRQYMDKLGNIRWTVGITGTSIDLVRKTMQPPTQEPEHETVSADDPEMVDNLPF